MLSVPVLVLLGASLGDVPQVVFPPVDAARLLAEDAAREDNGPVRFAEPIRVAITPRTDGAWEVDADGTRRWQLRIQVPAATDLNLGFTSFDLPDGASLSVIGEEAGDSAGPYTRDSATDGQLWTSALAGDRVLVVLSVPATAPDPALELGRIGAGYRDFVRHPRLGPVPKSGACNVDVICPEGDPWRDEIDSVAVYTLAGAWTCSGVLVMDVPRSFTPYFLTADHCDVLLQGAASVVTYWNFQAATCAGPRDGLLTQSISGSTLVARRSSTDFCLLELQAAPPAAWRPYWSGWDRTDAPAATSVSIHHPSSDEKAISLNDDRLTFSDSCIDASVNTHWLVDNYEQGTTEQGSSGGGLWNPASHRLVGWLSGGLASCSALDYDCYGRFAIAWDGVSASSRLRDWLDPAATSPSGVSGGQPGISSGTISLDGVTTTDRCLLGQGDANGAIEPGETVVLTATLVASDAFTGVQATLSSSTPGVTFPDGTAQWPDLAALAPAASLAPHLTARIGAGIACGTRLDFLLSANAAEGGPFDLPFSIDMPPSPTCMPCVAAPSVSLASFTVADACALGAGDQNGALDPGESAVITARLTSTGMLTGVQGTLSTAAPGVVVIDASADWPTLSAGAPTASLPDHLGITVDETTGCGTRLDFNLHVTSNEAGPWDLPLSIDLAPPATCRPCVAPVIALASFEVTDSCSLRPGQDLVVDPGEDVVLTASLTSTGPVTGVHGVLTTTAPGVVVTDGAADWPALIVGTPAPSLANHLGIRVNPTVPCGTRLDFNLHVTANEPGGPWDLPLSIDVAPPSTCRPCAPPSVSFASVDVADACFLRPGVSNLVIDPGEDAVLTVSLTSTEPVTGVRGGLSTRSSAVTITDRAADWPDLAARTPTPSLADHLAISVEATVLCGAQLDFDLLVTSNEAGPWSLPFSIDVAPSASCDTCAIGCVVREIAYGPLPPDVLSVRKGAAGSIVLSYPATTWCGGAIQVRMAATPRPAALPGLWPDDPPFLDVTLEDTDAGPDFAHDPPDDDGYYLVVETNADGTPGPSGSY